MKKGVRLYKLHGSITWYRTEVGDYKSIPIKPSDMEIKLSTDQPAVPLIVYPGRKLDYNEPIIDILVELKELLNTVKYVFVVGYSFKDDHITKLFRYAARRDDELIIFLINPSAYAIYDDKLKYHQDYEFPKNFDRSFIQNSFIAPVSSDLIRRVICLPYKFEKIIPLLKNEYLTKLMKAQSIENQLYIDEDEINRKNCLRLYLECEFMGKVDELIRSIGWTKLVLSDFLFSLEVSFKGIINSISYNDEYYYKKWLEYFEEVCKLFSIDKFNFIALKTQYIELEFNNAIVNISSKTLAGSLEKIIPFVEQKLKIVMDDKFSKINEFQDRIKLLIKYLHLWTDKNMTYNKYFQIRISNYPKEIEELKGRVNIYRNNLSSDERDPIIDGLISQIESKELLKIFGADRLSINFNLIRLLGYLSLKQEHRVVNGRPTNNFQR